MRVIAAMSGGVDSSVAAVLAKEAGWETIGVTMRLLPGGGTGFGCCGSPEDLHDAKRVCEKIGIRHYVSDMDEEFEKDVIAPFVSSYLEQRTPNPCVECNRKVKFGALHRLARAWGAERVVTGHYAQIIDRDNVRSLECAADDAKDQTYFLYSMTPEQLAETEFPLGDLTKAEVRERARTLGLKTADKPESQEICFVPGRDYRSFVRSRVPEGAKAFEAGPIKDKEGRELGTHAGLADYTIGQRRGLGLSGPRPFYVTSMDAETNTLVVGEGEDTVFSRLRVGSVSWTRPKAPAPGSVQVRVRHRSRREPARLVSIEGGVCVVEAEKGFSAPAPGQAAVFYDGQAVLGGGTIEEVL